MRHLENGLRRSPVAGTSWRRTSTTPPRALLAAHGLKEGTISSASAQLEGHWRCFLWDGETRQLYMGESQATGGFDAPPTGRARPMPPAQMDAIIAGESPPTGQLLQGRRIAEQVTDFLYATEPGPLVRLELEMQVPSSDHDRRDDIKERLRAVVRFVPRNRV